MKRKFKELQYVPKKMSAMLISIMILAFVIQMLNVFLTLAYPSLGMLDFYVFNTTNTIVENVICWLLPLVVGVGAGAGFNYFYPVRMPLFLRCNQQQFIMKRAIKTFWVGFWYVFLFYIFSFIFMFLTVIVIDPKIYLGVAINLKMSVVDPRYYFSFPYLYLLFYVICVSGFGGIYALVSFVMSLFVRNKIIVAMVPFVVFIAMMLIMEAVPFGLYFSANNAGNLEPSKLIFDTNWLYFIMTPLGIIILIAVLLLIVKNQGKADIC